MPPRKPQVGRPASVRIVSLSRQLPPLRLPRSAAPLAPARPHPQVGKVASLGQQLVPVADPSACTRCHHADGDHPVRYACDRYPHADPLQICGCVTEKVAEVCPGCGHASRSHKARRRCRMEECRCWGFQE